MAETDGSCGSAYRDMAVTADGYTLDNPYGRFAIYTDYAGWRQLASKLTDEATARLHHLHDAEDAPYDVYNTMVDRHNRVVRAFNALPEQSPLMTGGTIVESIGAAASVVLDTLCLMEEYDKATAALSGPSGPVKPLPRPGGIKPVPRPEPLLQGGRSKILDQVAMLGAFALGGYMLIKLTSKR